MSIPRRCTGGRPGTAPGAAQVRAAFSREARVLQNNKKLIRLFISRWALAAPLPLAACLDYLAAKKQDGGDAHRRHALGLELFAAGAPLRAGAAAQSPSQPLALVAPAPPEPSDAAAAGARGEGAVRPMRRPAVRAGGCGPGAAARREGGGPGAALPVVRAGHGHPGRGGHRSRCSRWPQRRFCLRRQCSWHIV